MEDMKKNMDIAISFVQSGDIEKSLKILNEIIKTEPYSFEPYFFIGTIEAKRKNYKSAIYYMKKAYNINPIVSCLKNIAKYYIELKDYKNALENLKMAMIYDSSDEELKRMYYSISPKNDFISQERHEVNGVYEKSKDCNCIKYMKAYDFEVINRKLPQFCENQFTETQKKLLTPAIQEYLVTETKEGFVLEINKGLIFAKQSDQTYFITPDNKLLLDMLDDKYPPLSVNKFPDILIPCERLLVLSSCYGGNFYHWLTWTVPRLKMIFDKGYTFKDFDKILINFVGFKFQKELLKMLSIPESKIIGTLSEGATFKVKNIVTASLPEFYKTPTIVTKSLREMLLKQEYMNETMPKRIYLSRNKSKSRFVLNENNLVAFLKEKNFVVIYAEDLTVQEQIQHFANADVIVSQHGAGLVNTAFCKPKTKVIEIYNEQLKNIIDTSFWQISNDVGLEHYFMFGEAVSSGACADMNVNIENLKELFNLAKI